MRHILVSAQFDRDHASPYPHVSTRYCQALSASGFLPLLASCAPVEDQAAACDALLLTGGGDLTPGYYPYTIPHTHLDFAEEARDQQEFALFQAFYQAGKPIFGICRGMQLINVALGGTLWEDLVLQKGITPHTNGVMHEIAACPDSWMFQLFGAHTSINSYHHQACRELAPGLIADAYDSDGIPEAFHHVSLPIYGVQWHPERMWTPGEQDDAGMSRIFTFWREQAGYSVHLV